MPKQRMDDFLSAVKTVRSNADQKPEPAITAVKTTNSQRGRITEIDRTDRAPPSDDPVKSEHSIDTDAPQTLEDALKLLRSQPSTDTLLATLRWLTSGDDDGSETTGLATPGPLQGQMINTIITHILPTFWPTLSKKHRHLLLACLTNVSGITALIGRLRQLSSSGFGRQDGGSEQLGLLLEVADELLLGPLSAHKESTTNGARKQVKSLIETSKQATARDPLALTIYKALYQSDLQRVDVKRNLAWKDFVNLISSGKIIAIVAQAEDSLRQKEKSLPRSQPWLSSGKEYARWLGREIAGLVQAGTNDTAFINVVDEAAQILAKALNLGYLSALMSGLFERLVDRESSGNRYIPRLVAKLPAFAKRQFLEKTVRWLGELSPSPDRGNEHEQPLSTSKGDVSAIAALIQALVSDAAAQEHLVVVLSDPVITSALSHTARRACIAALSATDSASDTLQTLLERLMTTFSDRLFIDHAPILQQEGIAQTLLLTAGYLHRQSPMAVLITARSSSHMQGTSSRLNASGQRARWLGMVVATAVSALVDKEGSRMDFGVEETRTEEARWYLGLTGVRDEVGTMHDFADLLRRSETAASHPARKPKSQVRNAKALPMINGKPTYGPPRPPVPVQTEVIGEKVTELLDDVSDEDEEDGLKPYAKPDSDPEDSDEDATLVNRHKARPPVYIRDVMRMLRDDKDHDRFQLGIKHAAPLIRRKTGFGKEVTDHAVELMGMLSNLQDPFETEEFDELRLQAMIALLLADVGAMGPWLSRQVFADGFSIAQRCLMMSALGLGGRELAGFKGEDELNPALADTTFASKRLPARSHATYTQAATASKRLTSVSKNVEDQLIKPLALRAADQSTAHLNAVKVRTFSSRMEVERTKRKPAANQLAKVFGQAFFFPLVGRYQQEIAAYGSSSVFASAPIVLVTFLKTLALLLHASGPATMGLVEVTAEFWDLLLGLRVQASGDISVLEAVLFALLTLLEVNTDKKRLAKEEAKRLMETQQWVEVIFERSGGGEMIVSGGGEEEVKVRTLAAGVLVRAREVVEEYQRELFGRVIE